MALVDLVDRLNLANVDTLVASACVQMPSLPAVSALQAKTGIPTLSASVATGHQMLEALDLGTHMSGFGALFE